MKEKLGKAGYPKEAVEYAVNFLKEYHFLDDNAYAQSYVRSYAGKKSRRQMVYEMQQKGVDPSYIEEALDQSPVDEEESARQALARRLKGKQEASYQEKGRLAAFLGRKGYSFEVINRVLREIKPLKPGLGPVVICLYCLSLRENKGKILDIILKKV